jgi:hypothetical protein
MAVISNYENCTASNKKFLGGYIYRFRRINWEVLVINERIIQMDLKKDCVRLQTALEVLKMAPLDGLG